MNKQEFDSIWSAIAKKMILSLFRYPTTAVIYYLYECMYACMYVCIMYVCNACMCVQIIDTE
jgi:hypothetical protein